MPAAGELPERVTNAARRDGSTIVIVSVPTARGAAPA